MNQAAFPLAAVFGALLHPSIALAETDEAPAIAPYADIRYRLELVDQDGLPEDAAASTLRLKAGVRLGEWNGLSAQVEGEAIARLGPRDYNDTVNGRSTFPVVADPSDVLLNQAFIQWRPDSVVEAKVGRQVVNLDNQRWIGSVGWRQNDQTFDAARLSLKPVKGLQIDYLHAWRVNRIFGPDSPQGIWRDTDIHGVRAAYDIKSVGTVSTYGYWLDIPASPANSTKTIGIRLAGKQRLGEKAGLLYSAEFARQSDHATNPADFRLDYLRFEPGFTMSGLTLRAGIERLEGNGTSALRTPLATLHAFNGWSDKFLATPPNGLRDLYADFSYRFGQGSGVEGLVLRAAYHDFDSTRAGLNYGREWDALASYPVTKQVTVLAKIAKYDAQDFATDTTKAWFAVQAKF